ncbi:hypothetical protein TNIN_428101 [Trichonephila inaurata madagascariensis]|uniref:Uncharacterized protein n=1 Tax=Trichonephila inaurata madagascariensis TaxID=2747483 RepID=A0A8X6WSL0_9ARAC|nr:hypothetical protein TNIN_428101 [Trichonephila inaurata madagascariensis]
MLFRFSSFNIELLAERNFTRYLLCNLGSVLEPPIKVRATFSLETIGYPDSAANDSEIYDRCEPQSKSTLTFLCRLIPAILTHKVIKATSPVQICLAVVV